jgi:YesN/AraC family two-component response regulator
MMPKMDGIEATKHLRDAGYTKPIVALTANAMVGQAQMFLQNGFDGFISKPIDMRDLNSLLNKLVRDKQPPDVIEEARKQMASGKKVKPPQASSQEQPESAFASREVAGLDIAAGLKRYDYDEEVYIKILRSYVSSVRSMLETVEVVGKDTLFDYHIKVHGIEGASRNIFAEQIGELAGNLKDAAKAEDFDYIEKHNPKFVEDLKEFIDAISTLISAINAETRKPKKDAPDTDALLRLAAACKVYDMDGTDSAMAEIEMYQYESGGDLVDWLRESVDMMRFPQIVEKLSNIN